MKTSGWRKRAEHAAVVTQQETTHRGSLHRLDHGHADAACVLKCCAVIGCLATAVSPLTQLFLLVHVLPALPCVSIRTRQSVFSTRCLISNEPFHPHHQPRFSLVGRPAALSPLVQSADGGGERHWESAPQSDIRSSRQPRLHPESKGSVWADKRSLAAAVTASVQRATCVPRNKTGS